MGLCNSYRRLFPSFSKVAKALTKLTRKETLFIWDEACQEAFNALKRLLTTAPVLRHFDPDRKTVLECDSSDYTLGGILWQPDHDGVLHPVAYFSKNLLPAECNYCIYDKELLAIIRCLEEWRPELESTEEPIKILTDHRALEYYTKEQKLNHRQSRWLGFLAEFNFVIEYQSAAANSKADH